MELKKEDVKHLADLACLELTAEELDRYGEQMSSILGYVSKLSELERAEAALTGSDAINVMRRDEVRPCPPSHRDALVKNFPDQSNDLLKVPAVFSEKNET
jgi:aspartyl-tRNA(Asn)/glutamyl-tRNA(Gln) amidotransferase subunit C